MNPPALSYYPPTRRMMTTHGCILLATASLAVAQDPSPTIGVDLQLISEQKQIAASHAFTLGLSIHHHEGFHTYWRNPGIVGVATALKWHLPQGFRAGPIQWPEPERIDMSGHPAHGYERDVLLLVEITPPPELTGSRVDLSVDVSWMACADTCHPGSTRLSITLPVADEPVVPTNDTNFSQARERIPHQMASLIFSSFVSSGAITLRVTPSKSSSSPKDAYFFSADGLISSDQPQVLKHLKNGAFELQMKVAEFGPKQAAKLLGVLSITQQDGSVTTGSISPPLVENLSNPKP